MFLRVSKKIISNNPDVSFLYAGGSTADVVKKYKDLVKNEGLSNKIFFVGSRDNILSILKSCDIFILTSYQEGMPNVIIEAMASKIPIVSTNVDGVSEIVKDGKNGFLVETNDTESMIEKINLLLTNPKLCNSIVENSYESAKKLFDLEKMVDEYEKLILGYIK